MRMLGASLLEIMLVRMLEIGANSMNDPFSMLWAPLLK